MASCGHHCRQARHCSQLRCHTGVPEPISIFRLGQILAQMPQELHFSSARKFLSISGTRGNINLYAQEKTIFCHKGPLSTGAVSWRATDGTIFSLYLFPSRRDFSAALRFRTRCHPRVCSWKAWGYQSRQLGADRYGALAFAAAAGWLQPDLH